MRIRPGFKDRPAPIKDGLERIEWGLGQPGFQDACANDHSDSTQIQSLVFLLWVLMEHKSLAPTLNMGTSCPKAIKVKMCHCVTAQKQIPAQRRRRLVKINERLGLKFPWGEERKITATHRKGCVWRQFCKSDGEIAPGGAEYQSQTGGREQANILQGVCVNHEFRMSDIKSTLITRVTYVTNCADNIITNSKSAETDVYDRLYKIDPMWLN